jgi:RimJ/RimL family protein N-acetyltransferase
MPALPELAQPLTDGAVSLRMAGEWDIPEILIAHQDDPLLHVALGQDRPPSGAELGRAAERFEAARLAGRSLTLTLVQTGGEDCRGRLTVHKLDWDSLRAELGIWVAPRLRNRGFASTALALAGRWLFDTARLERLGILTEPGNEPMVRAARAAGFVQEGVLRSYGRERGRRVDLAVMSLLPSDLGIR